MKISSVCAAMLLFALAGPAAAAEKAGVQLPEKVTVDGKELVLNGIGLRTKFMVKVYVGALYLPEKTTSAEKVITSDQPKRIVMAFLRDLDKSKMVEAITEGFELNSTEQQLAKLKERLDKLVGALNDVKKGDQFVITWLPGKGTHIKSGAKELTIEGKDFAEAMFAVWFGKKAADEDLKEEMLGL